MNGSHNYEYEHDPDTAHIARTDNPPLLLEHKRL